MKNLFYYYLAILLPFPFLIWAVVEKKNILFSVLIIVYFLYRGVVDANRLISLGIMEKKDFFKIYIPLWQLKYFKSLYFKK